MIAPPWDRAALPWLVAAPEDFRARCKAVTPGDDRRAGPVVRSLSNHRLDANQLDSLRRTIDRLRAGGADLSPLRPLRLAILGNGSTELIGSALVGTAARHGLAVELLAMPFDSADRLALDPGSELHAARPDVVLIHLTHRAFQLVPNTGFGDDAAAATMVGQALDRLTAIRDGIRAGCGANLIFATIPPPEGSLFGSLDRSVPGTPRATVDAINRSMPGLVAGSGQLVDVASLAECVGLDAWHSHAHWHAFKLPFAQRFAPLFAEQVAQVLAAMRGLARKCLVMDLDNTLWGGVIGDDGLDGIKLGQGSAVGEAFLDIQRTALSLRQRGIVLAISSKNDDHVARQPFREHPDMLLTEADISIFQANWHDKASNIKLIAEKLSLGTDSLVFLDDNPAEREQVRQRLPEVAVPELPSDPALYARTLLAAGYFSAVGFSVEDSRRAAMYAENAARVELEQAAGNLDDYLTSLAMRIDFRPFDAVGRSRIAQLINKSNQFNLTTRRYTEAEVASMGETASLLTLQVRLADRFGDNGMISVVICRPVAPDLMEIDTWLMSCRVLGRRVEQAVLHEIARRARLKGITTLRGRYIPSGRNAMVADHYANLGFQPMSGDGDGTLWRLDLADLTPAALPFELRIW